MKEAICPATVAASLTEHWSPRVLAELDDSFVKVAKVKGSLAWHSHDNEDELFYILKGSLTIEMEAGTVVLREGEAFVVPKGVRHNPIAERECLVMLIERKSTLHTGTQITDKTRSLAEQLRPLGGLGPADAETLCLTCEARSPSRFRLRPHNEESR